jgi:hypothetical protein
MYASIMNETPLELTHPNMASEFLISGVSLNPIPVHFSVRRL